MLGRCSLAQFLRCRLACRRHARAMADTARAAADTAGPSADVPEPLFRFGVVTDVQYADIADGTSFGGTARFYRNSLVNLRCEDGAAHAARRLAPLLLARC